MRATTRLTSTFAAKETSIAATVDWEVIEQVTHAEENKRGVRVADPTDPADVA